MRTAIALVLVGNLLAWPAEAGPHRNVDTWRLRASGLERRSERSRGRRAMRDLMRAGRLYARAYRGDRRPQDLEHALSAYVRAASVASRGRAARALLERARLLRRYRSAAEARAALKALLRQYPRGRTARHARRLLSKLRKAARRGRRRARRVVALRLEEDSGATRVIVELDGALSRIPAPLGAAPVNRVRLRLPRLRTSRKIRRWRPGRGLASRVRIRRFGRGLLLDTALRRSALARVYHLTRPPRLVVELTSPSAPEPRATTPNVPSLARVLRRVVIDPGHGGKDPGTVGRRLRLKEKDVTLAISKQLAQLLRRVGVEVLLTRTDDSHASLRDRTALANRVRADLFVSIHANSNPNRKRRGLETYYLDTTRDAYARRLAKRENSAGGGPTADLRYILADLLTKSNVESSMRLAGLVLNASAEHLRGRYSEVEEHGAKPALFYVLLGARMPAILVETSYLSNTDDEKRLKDPGYLRRIAEGIFLGLRRFSMGKAVGSLGPGRPRRACARSAWAAGRQKGAAPGPGACGATQG